MGCATYLYYIIFEMGYLHSSVYTLFFKIWDNFILMYTYSFLRYKKILFICIQTFFTTQDCAFAAFSEYAFGAVSIYSVLLLRYASVQYILSNPQKFKDFIPEMNSFSQSLICSGVWASEISLVAMAYLLERDFLLVYDSEEQDYNSNLFGESRYPPISVSFENKNHFTVLYPLDGNIKTGYPEKAPISSFINDTSLTLQKLKEETKYDPKLRAKYPPFAGSLLNVEKRVATPPITPIPKMKTTKIFLQSTLSFQKKRKEESVISKEENTMYVHIIFFF
jgi:hypothetical protein